jgi:hypothetical protein
VHFKQKVRLQISEDHLLKTRSKLYETQGEVVSGSIIDFFVPSHLLGFVIGKKGARIEMVESSVRKIFIQYTSKLFVVLFF